MATPTCHTLWLVLVCLLFIVRGTAGGDSEVKEASNLNPLYVMPLDPFSNPYYAPFTAQYSHVPEPGGSSNTPGVESIPAGLAGASEGIYASNNMAFAQTRQYYGNNGYWGAPSVPGAVGGLGFNGYYNTYGGPSNSNPPYTPYGGIVPNLPLPAAALLEVSASTHPAKQHKDSAESDLSDAKLAAFGLVQAHVEPLNLI